MLSERIVDAVKGEHTDVARQYEKVIVGQAAILSRIDQLLDVQAISGGVVVLQNLESAVEVQWLLIVQKLRMCALTHISICERHFGKQTARRL